MKWPSRSRCGCHLDTRVLDRAKKPRRLLVAAQLIASHPLLPLRTPSPHPIPLLPPRPERYARRADTSARTSARDVQNGAVRWLV